MTKLITFCLFSLVVPFAFSATELNPATIQPSDASGKANWIRLKMAEVNGETNGYILASGHGPQEGYIGEINELTSTSGFGAVLNSNSITTCANIPTTGSLSGTVTEDGETLSYVLTFSAGTKALPSFYDNASETLATRVVVAEGGTNIMAVEFTCETNNITSFYALYPSSADNSRAREMYYQKNSSTGKTRVDVHMTASTNEEHYAFRFLFDSSIARIWNIRTVAASGGSSSGFAAVINTATGVTQTRFIEGSVALTDTTTLDAASQECIDLSTGAASSSCTAQSLTVTAPDQTPSIGGTQYDYVINSIKNIVIDTL